MEHVFRLFITLYYFLIFVALSQASGKTIWLRNQLLKMLLDVIRSDKLHLSSE